ncbi:hypothetical protein RhiirA4_459491 [Rhizophagus irregularis]|uniref:Uncharacterized protein n=1 Tax=Rhizophagus irregularis TaxID=588596 RepID=A0A2I1GEF6_9GLOM|nr:hypothetical protein RhiirA4_459491 [Rhizophagus irregularis]
MEHLIHRTQSLCVCSRHLRKSKHVSEIRSLIRQSQNISDVTFKRKIKSIFKINEREYLAIGYLLSHYAHGIKIPLTFISALKYPKSQDGLDIKKCPSDITTSLSGDEKDNTKISHPNDKPLNINANIIR